MSNIDPSTVSSTLEFEAECSDDCCSRRAIALAIVGRWENLPGIVASEIAACDGTPCMLSTEKGADALEELITDPYWDGFDNAA